MSAASKQHATNAPALPRVGIHSLPTELKQLIVRICDADDRALAKALRLRPDGSETDALETYSSSFLDMTRRLPRCTIGALFRVSREWSELAAPYRFKTLTAKHASQAFFRKYVLPRRAGYFTSFAMLAEPRFKPEELTQIATVLSQLHNVTHAVMLNPYKLEQALYSVPYWEREVFRSKKGRPSKTTEDPVVPEEARALLLDLLRRISRLELEGWDFELNVRLLMSIGTRLQELRIQANGTEIIEVTNALPDLLAGLPSLKALSLSFKKLPRLAFHTPTMRLPVNSANPFTLLPRLERFELALCDFDAVPPEFSRLIANFQDSLVSLALCINGKSLAMRAVQLSKGASRSSRTSPLRETPVVTSDTIFETGKLVMPNLADGVRVERSALKIPYQGLAGEQDDDFPSRGLRGTIYSSAAAASSIAPQASETPTILADQLRHRLDYVNEWASSAIEVGAMDAMKGLIAGLEIFEERRTFLDAWRSW